MMMAETTTLNANDRCTVCSKPCLEKACPTCVEEYGDQFDLSSPEGRYQARVAKQGTSSTRWAETQQKLDIARAERQEQMKPLVEKLSAKLSAANEALRMHRYEEIADVLKGIERLAKKIKSLFGQA